eukprot:COSAG06_NODE_1908_length_8088_cov_2.473526_7_plen_82_part_00
MAVALDVDHVAVERPRRLSEVDRRQLERRDHGLYLVELDALAGVLRPKRAHGVSRRGVSVDLSGDGRERSGQRTARFLSGP